MMQMTSSEHESFRSNLLVDDPSCQFLADVSDIIGMIVVVPKLNAT